jgi:hypothetical protein
MENKKSNIIESLRRGPPPRRFPLPRGLPPARNPPSSRYAGACGRFIRSMDEKDKTISQRNGTITALTTKVGELNTFKYSCIDTNNRLITKNNALLDSTQFFNDQLFGNEATPGYTQTLVKTQMEKDDILNQKIGQVVARREGFSMYNKLEGENTIIQSQIDANVQEHSVDNQKYVNLNNQIEFLNRANEILGWILFAVIIICAIVIWRSNESLTHKLVMIKVIWLYLILVEILEYVLFYVYRYFNALFFGQPYTASDYWKFPHLSWMDIGIIILIVLSVFI